MCGHKYPIDSTSSFDEEQETSSPDPSSAEDTDSFNKNSLTSEQQKKFTMDKRQTSSKELTVTSEPNMQYAKNDCHGGELEI